MWERAVTFGFLCHCHAHISASKKRILQYGVVSMKCLILKNRYYWRSLVLF